MVVADSSKTRKMMTVHSIFSSILPLRRDFLQPIELLSLQFRRLLARKLAPRAPYAHVVEQEGVY